MSNKQLEKGKERAMAIRSYRHLLRLQKRSRTIAEFQRYSAEAQKIKNDYNL